jgi:hypothetical protein
MVRFRRILSVPMFLTALGLAWILGRQTGVDGMAVGLAAARRSGSPVVGRARAAGGLGPADPSPLAPRRPSLRAGAGRRPARASRCALGRAVQRGAARRAARRGRPGLRLFHRRLVPDLQGQRAAALGRDEVAEAFGARRGGRCWSATGPAATPRSAASSRSHGRSGVPLYLWYAPGREAEVLPQILTAQLIARNACPWRRQGSFPRKRRIHLGRRAGSPLARGRRGYFGHTFTPATQVSSRSMRMKSAHLPGSRLPICPRRSRHRPRRG